MSKAPYFSIICATYNRGNIIARAIDSVIVQNNSDWQLIIVDDGSTDDTANVVRPYLDDNRISYHQFSYNRGVGAARNHAIALASGLWVFILDSDNALTPDSLSYMKDVTVQRPDIKMHRFAVQSFSGKMMGQAFKQPTTVTAKQYLQGKVKGEHQTLVDKYYHQQYPFIETVNGAENIVWSQIVIEIETILYHPFITLYYEDDSDDRLSNRSTNYQRLRKVYQAEFFNLWKIWLRYAPLKCFTSIIKMSAYSVLEKIKR